MLYTWVSYMHTFPSTTSIHICVRIHILNFAVLLQCVHVCSLVMPQAMFNLAQPAAHKVRKVQVKWGWDWGYSA